MTFRVGTGFDVHAFSDTGEGFVVGGVFIPYQKNIKAHSDGDVLLHAICDALLGAAALGDIGDYFPNTDEYKDADSIDLLKQTVQLIESHSWAIVNLDAVIILEQPVLKTFIPQMRQNIASVLKTALDCVSVKATTADKLGSIGRNEGIAAMTHVLLMRQTST